jgi:hypothetical protein
MGKENFYLGIIIISVVVLWIVSLKNEKAKDITLQHKKTIENYPMTIGMIGDQRLYYDRCVNNCWRNFTGDSKPEELLWKCTDDCQVNSNIRKIQKVPDITAEEHQRHYDKCYHSSDPELCYCVEDMKDFCENRLCDKAFDHTSCVNSCIKVKSQDCRGGMVSGWRP